MLFHWKVPFHGMDFAWSGALGAAIFGLSAGPNRITGVWFAFCRFFIIGFSLLGCCCFAGPWIISHSLYLSIPTLTGIQFQRRCVSSRLFWCAFVAMTVYRSGAMRETFARGMQSIDRGQSEAAFTLVFSRVQSLRWFLFLRQFRFHYFLRWTNSWLAATKFVVGGASGFPELVSVFMQTSDESKRPAIEIIFMVMGFIYSSACWSLTCSTSYNDSVPYKVR